MATAHPLKFPLILAGLALMVLKVAVLMCLGRGKTPTSEES